MRNSPSSKITSAGPNKIPLPQQKNRIMGPKTFRDPNKKNTKNMSIAPHQKTPKFTDLQCFCSRDESAPKPIPQVDWDLRKMEEGNRKVAKWYKLQVETFTSQNT